MQVACFLLICEAKHYVAAKRVSFLQRIFTRIALQKHGYFDSTCQKASLGHIDELTHPLIIARFQIISYPSKVVILFIITWNREEYMSILILSPGYYRMLWSRPLHSLLFHKFKTVFIWILIRVMILIFMCVRKIWLL